MGWQQFLNNSSVPLKQRLHGAHVAFLASSQELSTQQKEDVVILWLTRLVKEKQMSTWQEDTNSEQEQVWRLLDQLFSSQRLQLLVSKAWTCPITTMFPQSIVDVLGAPELGAETRRHVVSTACSMILTPALATIITNSTTLSLQITTALLDAVIDAKWAQLEAERLKLDKAQQARHLDAAKRHKSGRQPTEGQSVSASPLFKHHEKVLKALSVIIDDVASQLLVKNDESAVKFCCQQLLKRMVSLELSAKVYNGSAKFSLLQKIEKLIKGSLFNSNVTAQYKTFLSFLKVEDCKAFTEASLIPVVLSSLSTIMSNGPPQAASRAVSLFFEGFLHKFEEDDCRVAMLACLLHLSGLDLRGDVISCDSEALEFIERTRLEDRAQEGIVVTLLKPLQNLDRIRRGSPLCEYLVLLLNHIMARQPLTSNWFVAMRGLLTLLPEDLSEELQAALGEMLTATKPDEESLDTVSSLLQDLFQYYSSRARPIDCISLVLRSIIANKHKLRSHKEIIPYICLSGQTDLKALIPPRFLSSLSGVLGNAEPLMFCDLFLDLFTSTKALLLPLISASDDGSGRAVACCCWVLSAVLVGASPCRVVAVERLREEIIDAIIVWLEELLNPLLSSLATQEKLDQARCCGLLLLSHAFLTFLFELRRSDAFVELWDRRSGPPSLVPHTSPAAWGDLVACLQASNDATTRSLLLRLVLMRLQQLQAEGKRSRYGNLGGQPSRGRRASGADLSPSKESSHDELVASLDSTFSKVLEGSPAKDMPKLVRELLCDNLLSSLHAVPSCHRTVAKYLVSAYLSNPKLVQKAICGQANLAALILQLVQSALGRLTAALQPCKAPEGAGKKRKLAASGKEEKNKKPKRESEGATESRDGSTNNCNDLDASEDPVNDLSNPCDDLFAILHTVCFRLQNIEKGGDKKKINKDSVKMKHHLGRITELVSGDHGVTFVEYSDLDSATQICSFFLDVKLSALSVPQVVAVLQAFLALFFLTRIDDKQHKKIAVALLRCINVCFDVLPQDARVVSPDLLAVMAMRLVTMRSQDSVFQAAVKVGLGHSLPKLDASFVVHFDTALNFVVRQLVQLRGVDAVGRVAACLIDCVGREGHPQPALHEHHLHTAWQLVSHCAQAAREGTNNQTSRYCRGAVRTLALWCLPDDPTSPQAPPPHAAFFLLSMYSELLSLELGRSTREETSHSDLAGQEDEASAPTGGTNQDSSALEASAAEDKEYLDRLPSAWSLAQWCLNSSWSPLQACALQFLARLRRMAPPLRPQCSDEDISSAFISFLQQEMLATRRGKGSEQPLQLPIPLGKKSEVVTPADLSAQNKEALKEFLTYCPVDTYRDLLRGLLERSLSFDGFLAPRTQQLWRLLMGADVSSVEGRRTKRAALRTLSQMLVRFLQGPPSSSRGTSAALTADAMVTVLETLSTIMKQPLSLPHQTVMQVLTAASAPTSHLSTPHFVLVWQQQVALVSATLVSRTGAWPGRVSGLLAALQALITALAQRSSSYDPQTLEHREALTSCCLSMEQLLRKLHPLHRDLHHVLHLTAGSIIAVLQRHSVIPPVKNVLDAEIYKLLKVCDPKGLDHLAVALPAKTRPLLHHYRNNFNKYYAVDHTKE